MGDSLLPIQVRPAEWDPARFDDVERLQRRERLSEIANAEAARIYESRRKLRSAMTLSRVWEQLGTKRHLRDDKEERLQRWKARTQANPLTRDLWAEDEAAYNAVRAKTLRTRVAEKRQNKVNQEARHMVLQAGLAERDELSDLRTEKRHLLDEKKRLECLLSVEKKNKQVEALQVLRQKFQRELQNRPQLQMVTSDYCTRPIKEGDGLTPRSLAKYYPKSKAKARAKAKARSEQRGPSEEATVSGSSRSQSQMSSHM